MTIIAITTIICVTLYGIVRRVTGMDERIEIRKLEVEEQKLLTSGEKT